MKHIFFFIVYVLLYFVDIKFFNINIATFLVPVFIFFQSYQNRNLINVLNDKNLYFLLLMYLWYSIVVFINNSIFESLVIISNYLYVILAVMICNNLTKKNIRFINYYSALFLVVFIIEFILNYFQSGSTLDINVFGFKHRTGLAYQIFYTFVLFSQTSTDRRYLVNMFIITFIALIINSSRGPLIMMLIFSFYLFRKNLNLKFISYISIFSIITSQIFAKEFIFSFDRLKNIFSLDSSGGSNLYRLESHLSLIEYLKNNPFGNGLNSFFNNFQMFTDLNLKTAEKLPPDSSFVLIAYDTGIIGLALLSLFFFNYARRNYNNKITLILIICVLLNFLADEKFNGGIFVSIVSLFLTKKKL